MVINTDGRSLEQFNREEYGPTASRSPVLFTMVKYPPPSGPVLPNNCVWTLELAPSDPIADTDYRLRDAFDKVQTAIPFPLRFRLTSGLQEDSAAFKPGGCMDRIPLISSRTLFGNIGYLPV